MRSQTIRSCWLLGNSDQTQTLAKELLNHNWRFVSVDEQHQQSSLDIHVGIIDLSDRNILSELETHAAILSNIRISWIALLSQKDLEDDQRRQAISNFCWDYTTLPVSVARLVPMLGHALGISKIMSPNVAHQSVIHSIIGQCPSIIKIRAWVDKVADSDAPILITGETGTGKEVVAQAIHEESRRRKKNFSAINCGAVPTQLLQSELFGHEKGSFTGAIQRKIGRIEVAHKGTLFLDEIGDLPFDAQVNLLRFLQEHTIQRIGSNETIEVDVRVIAATHVDLDEAISAGRFRLDLLHRLNVLHIDLPPLRERGSDITLLAEHYFELFKKERLRGKARGFSAEAIEVMQQYEWPGNVRELVNRVRRALIMAEGRQLRAQDLGLNISSTHTITLDTARDLAERKAIGSALARHPRNLSRAAKELGVSRVTLYRLIEKHRDELTTPEGVWIPKILSTSK